MTRFLAALSICLAAATPARGAGAVNTAVLGQVVVDPVEGFLDALFVHDNLVFFLERWAQGTSVETWLHIYDTDDPASPRLLSRTQMSARIADMHGIYYSNGILYVGTQQAGGGLHIFDLSDPTRPVALISGDPARPGVLNATSGVHNMRLAGKYLYLLPNGADPDIQVYDVSDPGNPVKVNEFSFDPARPEDSFCHDMTIVNDVGYASCWDQGFFLFDLRDPRANPFPSYNGSGSVNNTHSAWPTADLQHVITCHEASLEPVRIWDSVASPALELARYRSTDITTDNLAHDVMVVGNYAYLSHYGESLRILDISRPDAPVEVGSFQSGPGCSGYCRGIAQWVENGLVYYLDMTNGLYVLDFQLPHPAPLTLYAVKSGAGQDVALTWNFNGETQYTVRRRLPKGDVTGARLTDVDGYTYFTDAGAVPGGNLYYYTLNGPWRGLP